MVSDALRAFSGHFSHWAAQGGVQLDRRVCQMLADQFGDLSANAITLEGQPVPAALRGNLPDQVVNLDLAREARLLRRQGGDWGGGMIPPETAPERGVLTARELAVLRQILIRSCQPRRIARAMCAQSPGIKALASLMAARVSSSMRASARASAESGQGETT